jgi:hypothetical protein
MQVESRITDLTLHARGARVRRAASVALTGSRIRMTGLAVAALDDTEYRIRSQRGVAGV